MHSEGFLNDRRAALERYLQVISTHEHIRFDIDLKAFLTAQDYKSTSTPYLKKLQDACNILPNLGQIFIDKDAAEAYMQLISKK